MDKLTGVKSKYFTKLLITYLCEGKPMKKIRNRKRMINYIIVGLFLGIMTWLILEEYKDTKIGKDVMSEKSQYNTQDLSTLYDNKVEVVEEENQINTAVEEIKEYPKEEIIKQYAGYSVIAKLEIPVINLETYILKPYSVQALNVSVTKFWGANPNEVGNFCVAGHNFQNKNMFHNLRKLEVGNQLTISDNTIGKIVYEIYDIYKVQPEDVSCLSQETYGKREVTLITCTIDSEKRIIVKAKELEE